jgi:cell division protein FtsI (penicillin-binding protein 3)
MRKMFEDVVLEGTGTLAQLDGYTSGGKTGTAQKIDPRTGTYSITDHIASYVGFAPVNSAAVTVLVSLDSPQGIHHGGDVAAPVFKRITEQVLAYLDLPNDVTMPSGQQMAALREKPNQALPDVSDFSPQQDAQRVETSSLPVFPPEPAKSETRDGSGGLSYAPTIALEEGEGVEVPQLAGKTVRGVTEACLRLGLSPVLIGAGVATEQNPMAGTRVRAGSRITVRFSRTAATAEVQGRGGVKPHGAQLAAAGKGN